MSSWQHTLLLMGGVVLAMTGVALFVGIADYDYKFALKTVSDDPPHGVADIRPYAGLSEHQTDVFERARNGETVRFEDENPMPEVVERDGTYYVAEAPRYIDWTDPRTFGPTLLFLIGAGTAIQAARLDVRASGLP